MRSESTDNPNMETGTFGNNSFLVVLRPLVDPEAENFDLLRGEL
jgi:hypothetical protein